jgi:nucleotide-binding universal stress UspA family protein
MTSPFRRILVPHDFSIQSGEALRVAADLAVMHGGRLQVLHVISPPVSIGEITWVERGDLRMALRKRLQDEVDAILRRRKVKASVDVVVGDPATVIVGAARGADAIVMSTLGQTGIARWLVGSVAEKVVRLSPVPVLTIRAAARKPRARRAARSERVARR